MVRSSAGRFLRKRETRRTVPVPAWIKGKTNIALFKRIVNRLLWKRRMEQRNADVKFAKYRRYHIGRQKYLKQKQIDWILGWKRKFRKQGRRWPKGFRAGRRPANF